MKELDEIDDRTPIAMLTVGQLKAVLSSVMSVSEVSDKPRNVVFGIDGICSLFNCGKTKAQSLKNTVIKDAVTQHGRKIVVDVQQAMDLFNNQCDNRK